MSTKQPCYVFVANLGDCDPLNHGGLFVYTDSTGVYDPCAVLLELRNPDREPSKRNPWTVRRFDLPACTYDEATDTLSANRFHPLHAEWFAHNTAERAARPQDGKGLEEIASFIGMEKEDLIALFLSSDPCERAHAWRAVGDFHGFDNLDEYPETYSRKDLYRLYRKECFPRSVRRTHSKRARVPSGEVGPFRVATI